MVHVNKKDRPKPHSKQQPISRRAASRVWELPCPSDSNEAIFRVGMKGCFMQSK